MFKYIAVLVVLFSFQKVSSQSVIRQIDEVKINAKNPNISEFELNNTTSVADYISYKQLKKYNFNDASKILSSVNGVYIYEEDGYGLRPNISIRGTSGVRSSKINLMEDGVPIAPAPYSASSAYYFPTMNRMKAIEILKGNSQIQYGPHTTGGAINMVSTAIPDSLRLSMNMNYGSFNTVNLLGNIGYSDKHYGLLAEFSHNSSDGFKQIQGHENLNTGFNKNEVMLKGQVNSDLSKAQHHILSAKFHYYDEVSNETYLGLSKSDFEKNPLMRYQGSMNDVMKADHFLYNLKYKFQLNKNTKWTTTAYLNQFKRNWYKLNDITIDDNKVSISSILNDTEKYGEYYDILNGQATKDGDFLKLRANNRAYVSKGIQSKIVHNYTIGKTENITEIGTRVHYDEEDRFQWEDKVGMNNGSLFAISSGVRGSQSNKVTSTLAWSSYLYHTLKIDKLTLTGGVRYEMINGLSEDYGKSDTARTGTDLKTKENEYGVWIPGMGFSYTINNNWNVFGGVHKGFSPATVVSDVEPESSINYELGAKYRMKRLSVQVVSFMNDYQNMLGSNPNAVGGGGTLDQYNAGAVIVKGLECSLEKRFVLKKSYTAIPIKVGYTFTDARFKTSFDSKNELWGDVSENDLLPFIASHQGFLDVGYEYKKMSINLLTRYKSEMLTHASSTFEDESAIPATWVSDMSVKYQFNQNINLGLSIQNLFDTQNPVSNIPAGFRTMMPRFISASFGIDF